MKKTMNNNVINFRKLRKAGALLATGLVLAMPNAMSLTPNDPTYDPNGNWPGGGAQTSSVVGAINPLTTIQIAGLQANFTRSSGTTECFTTGLSYTLNLTIVPPAGLVGYTAGPPTVTYTIQGGFTGSGTGTSVSVTPVAQVGRHNKGRVTAVYKVVYSKVITGTTTSVCNGVTITTPYSYTDTETRDGSAYTDLYQQFAWSESIEGPECVIQGETVVYSIKDLVSGNLQTGIGLDNYYWRFPTAWAESYNSGDNSSITVQTNTLNSTDEIFVQVGRCNTNTVSLKIRQPQAPLPQTLNICTGPTATFPLSTVAGVTYTWNIAADGKGHTYNTGNANTQGPITVNLAGTGDGYVALTSLVPALGSCPASSRVDNINFTRSFAPATHSITGPVCVSKGSSYTYSVTNATTVNWTLPAGVTITSTPITAPSITVLIGPTYAGNLAIKASNGNALCTGVQSTVTTLPILVTPATPVATSAPTCVVPGVSVNYTVTAVAGLNYTWSFPAGYSPLTASGASVNVVPGTTSGQITVTATPSTGTCPSAALTINVAPKITPVVPASASVCTGSPLVLSANAVPGATYAWTGPNAFTSPNQSPTVSAAATSIMAGTYSLTVSINGCVGNAASTVVTVKAKPVVNTATNNGPVCAGTALNLASTVSIPGGTFAWAGPNAFTSAVQNPTVSAATTSIMAGTYSLVYTVAGCASNAASTAVTVKAKPVVNTATNNGPVCAGTLLNLASTVSIPGGTFAWTGPNAFTSAIQSPTVSAAATSVHAGTYSLVYTVAGCASASVSTTAVVNTPGVMSVTRATEPGAETLTATAGFGPYVWTKNGAVISGVTGRILDLSGGNSGANINYCVTGTQNGCTTPPNCNLSVYNNARVAAPVEAVSVYPNPAETEISITISESLIGSAYTITNTSGVKLRTAVFSTSPEKVSISGWAAGTYIISYTLNDKAASTKFIVK